MVMLGTNLLLAILAAVLAIVSGRSFHAAHFEPKAYFGTKSHKYLIAIITLLMAFTIVGIMYFNSQK